MLLIWKPLNSSNTTFIPQPGGPPAYAGPAGKRDEALEEFDEAERLYRAAASVEGESETSLRRATYLASLGRLAEARPPGWALVRTW